MILSLRINLKMSAKRKLKIKVLIPHSKRNLNFLLSKKTLSKKAVHSIRIKLTIKWTKCCKISRKCRTKAEKPLSTRHVMSTRCRKMWSVLLVQKEYVTSVECLEPIKVIYINKIKNFIRTQMHLKTRSLKSIKR